MGGIISPRVCLIWKVVLFTKISPPKMGCSHNIGSITQRWGFKDAINVGDQWHVESGHNNDHYTPIIFAPITCNIQTCWIELYRHGMMFGTCTYGCFLKWDGTPNHPKYSIFFIETHDFEKPPYKNVDILNVDCGWLNNHVSCSWSWPTWVPASRGANHCYRKDIHNIISNIWYIINIYIYRHIF
jgi:hypothetical protein